MSVARNIADLFSKATALSTDTEISSAIVAERTTVATLSGKTLLAPSMTNIIVNPTNSSSTPITINGVASQSTDYLNINTLTTGGTNLVKIDVNGNLGLGVTPSVKLDIGGQVYVRGGTSNTGAVFVINSDPTSGANGVTLETSFAAGGYGPLIFKNGNSERMRIDSSGVLSMPNTGTFYKSPLKSSLEYVGLLSTAGAFNSNYTYYVNSGTVQYITSNSTGNALINVVGDGSNTFNSLINVGQSITCVLFVTNSTSAYYVNAFYIDGVIQTVKWQGGITPSAGNANAVDVYTFTIIKTAATPTYAVLGSLTKFA
jgi:hypothetical protein